MEPPLFNTQVEDWASQIGEVGFAKAEGLVPLWLTRALAEGSDELLCRPSIDWSQSYRFYESHDWQPTAFASPGKASTFMDFLGESTKLDHAVDTLLSMPAIRHLLDEILGKNHRIWYASIRRAEIGCEGLPIHQDIQGEMGLCVLLSDTDENDGQIAFVPGSHRWARGGEQATGLATNLVNRYLERATGSAGDIYFFLNKTWHGRTPAGRRPATVLILTFIPEQAGDWGRRLPSATCERLGPRVRELTRDDAGRLPPGAVYDELGFAVGPNRPLAVEAESSVSSPLSPWHLFRFGTRARRIALAFARRFYRISA